MSKPQNMFDESDFQTEVTQDQLFSIAELANHQIQLENDLEEAEQHVKDVKKQLAKVQTELLPTALETAGMTEFKTVAGEKIVIKEDITISVPKDKKEPIAKWLTENGHEAVITGTIVVKLPKDSEDERQAAIEALTDIGLEPVETLDFNTMTLKAILKSLLKEGKDIKLEEFGAFAWRKAEIKRV